MVNKYYPLLFGLLLLSVMTPAQNVGIGTNTMGQDINKAESRFPRLVG
jgi:hypothetical protein